MILLIEKMRLPTITKLPKGATSVSLNFTPKKNQNKALWKNY